MSRPLGMPVAVSGPFRDGLVVVFAAAAVMMVVGAIASALTGGPTREEA